VQPHYHEAETFLEAQLPDYWIVYGRHPTTSVHHILLSLTSFLGEMEKIRFVLHHYKNIVGSLKKNIESIRRAQHYMLQKIWERGLNNSFVHATVSK
jgi:hypothetical protein